MTIEDLTPEEREQVMLLWLRQHRARRLAASGGGRRKGDKKP